MTKCSICNKEMGEVATHVQFCSIRCLDKHIRELRQELIGMVKR